MVYKDYELQHLEHGDIVYWSDGVGEFARHKEAVVVNVKKKGNIVTVTIEPPLKGYGRTFVGYYTSSVATGSYGSFICTLKWEQEQLRGLFIKTDEWIDKREREMDAIAALKRLKRYFKDEE